MGIENIEQNGKGRGGARGEGKKTLELQTKTAGCLAMSKVDVGVDIQIPGRAVRFARGEG